MLEKPKTGMVVCILLIPKMNLVLNITKPQ